MTTTLQVQERLIALGYYLGPTGADGVPGRNTTKAIANFQADKGLDIKNPGSVGPKTIAALGLDATAPIVPPWVAEARRFLGLHEVRDEKRLRKALRLDASEIAWCGPSPGWSSPRRCRTNRRRQTRSAPATG